MSTLWRSPDESSETCFLRRWSMPNVCMAFLAILSSSGFSHQILSTYGYLPSMTMSITDMPNVCPASAGTLATSLATSAGFIPSTSRPST